ncbi:MAG: DUF692 family protein [Chloroflexi bacterium]|nr:MAG: DUF692 family protein [Chloroflexota bacterium]
MGRRTSGATGHLSQNPYPLYNLNLFSFRLMMQFAVNYSPQAAELVQAGRVQIDMFKCPPWPELVAEAQGYGPVYVHFSLVVGPGLGDAITRRGEAPNWELVEHFLATTCTTHINLHISTNRRHYLDGSPDRELTPERVTEQLIRDVEGVCRRFGRDRVVVENGYRSDEVRVLAATFPEVITQVVEETGCGFLFDLSHARLATTYLGRDVFDYIAHLPLAHTREIHLTGIQHFGPEWVERMRAFGVGEDFLRPLIGIDMDHLPLSEEDWSFMQWAAEAIRHGAWGQPQLVALECGGVGPFWQASIVDGLLDEQLPRLYRLFKT